MAGSAPPIPVRKTVPATPCGAAAHARFSLDAFTMTPLKLAVLPALLALSLCQTTTAGTVSSASLQATFVVHEACTVVSQRNSTQVRCLHNTPYLLLQQATPSGAGLVTVTF
jgi:hypothetical protein